MHGVSNIKLTLTCNYIDHLEQCLSHGNLGKRVLWTWGLLLLSQLFRNDSLKKEKNYPLYVQTIKNYNVTNYKI